MSAGPVGGGRSGITPPYRDKVGVISTMAADRRLGEFPGDEAGVREITRMDRQIEAVFDNRCRTLGRCHLNCHVRVCRKKCRQL